jgi:hypothetical protein
MPAPILFAMLAQAAVPLQPMGSWIVQGEDNMCAILHAYGEGRQQITLGMRMWPAGIRADVLLSGEELPIPLGHGPMHFSIDGSPPINVGYELRQIGRKTGMASFTVPENFVDTMAKAHRVSVSFSYGKPIEISLPASSQAFATLHLCQEMLQKKLGIDLPVLARVKTQASPIGDPISWFTSADYPNPWSALGTTKLLLTIDEVGQVTNCAPFATMGDSLVDAAVCVAFKKRGRYNPALGADGKPVPTYFYHTVRWVR